MRFLNGYEIPYQAEDFFEVPGTSVQVSDKNLYQLYFAETLPMEAITNKPIISCPKMWKNNDKNSKSSTEVGVGQKLFERSNPCL